MTDAGEMILWIILAIQEIPCLSFEPHVSKIPSTGNTIDSGIFITIEDFVLSNSYHKKSGSVIFYENVFKQIPHLK